MKEFLRVTGLAILLTIVTIMACKKNDGRGYASQSLTIKTWVTKDMNVNPMSGATNPEYDCHPLEIYNSSDTPVVFDRITINYRRSDDSLLPIAADIIFSIKPDQPPGTYTRNAHYIYANDNDDTDAQVEPPITRTIQAQTFISMGHFSLDPEEPPGQTTAIIALHNGGKVLFTSGPIQLPPWTSVPDAMEVWESGTYKDPSVLGYPLEIVLKPPTDPNHS